MYVYVCFTKCDCLRYVFSNTIIDHAVIQEFDCNQKQLTFQNYMVWTFKNFKNYFHQIFWQCIVGSIVKYKE